MKDIFNLEGKNAIVIGGAGGIGQAIAQGLAFYGANVSLQAEVLNLYREIKVKLKKLLIKK